MGNAIIHPQENGTLAITFPASECGIPVEEIAKKDVPPGVPYLIVDVTQLPPDWDYRAAWEADFSHPHGTGLGHEAWIATGWKDPNAFDLETHNANAASDMMAQIQATAEQENAQFDALQKLKGNTT